jgi:hypothetical protein
MSPSVKDHVLFVGTDLAVKEGNQFYHVVGAKKGALQIEKNHRVTEVHLGQGADIRVSRGVKLSRLSAAIDNLRTESVDRAAARAQLEAMKASMMMEVVSADGADRLQGGIAVADQGTSINPDATFNPDATRAFIAQVRNGAQSAYSNGVAEFARTANLASSHFSENLNASTSAEVEVTFDVSSPEPINQAYIVVVATYGTASKTNEISRQISAQEFDHIDAQPRHVRMSHPAELNGLPFKKFDVGLFANGQEVATNLSEKRLPLTSDQAYQFFLIDHLSHHRNATMPPTPLLMTPRSEFRRQVEQAGTNQTIYANVDKSGNVLAVSADAAGTQRLSPTVESALKNVRFLPALDNGTPVDGRTKVTLAQLTK